MSSETGHAESRAMADREVSDPIGPSGLPVNVLDDPTPIQELL
jgi:hypothetical protein